MRKIDATIVIPVKNGGNVLKILLNKIFSQKTTLEYEIIVVDSGSKDNSLEIIKKYPKVTSKGRPLYSKYDTPNYTSIETYLKGELSSYSVKTLKLYYEYIQSCVTNNINLAENNLENIVLEKGYSSIEEAEKSL